MQAHPAAAGFRAVQNGRMESLRGRLLVADPQLVEPNFRRTVVFMVAHTLDGALGLVLNRPSRVGVAEVAPELDVLADPDDVVYAGGPVATGGLIVMLEFAEPGEPGEMVFGDRIGLLSSESDLAEVAGAVRRSRVYAGHAGWGPGQLDAEVEAAGWFVLDAARGDFFSSRADELWSQVLRRQGGQLALVARMPIDVSVN